MKIEQLTALIVTLLLPVLAQAQSNAQIPLPELPTLDSKPSPTPAAPAPSLTVAQTAEPTPVLVVDPLLAPKPSATPAAATPSPLATPMAVEANPPPVLEPGNSIRLNFENASLSDVLGYLSEAAGFVIVQEAKVAGTVNIVCKQPITANEAVDLLNTVLIEKGYVAIRNGRILKIVSSHDAQKQDLPVVLGSDPEKIPRKDEMVTQILPLRFVEAGKLIENLRPLLSADATISSNDNSNAIILSDKQTNIHRIAEIIHALDTSISSISSIHVFRLRYADAKDFANVLTQLFNPDQSGRNGQQNQGLPLFGRFGGGGGGRGGGGGGGGNPGPPAAPESEARKAASRVVAVSDDQTNSVIVSAPEEYMTTITDIVDRLDTSTTDVTETRIFRLEHADSMELSNILNSLYGDSTTTSGANANRNGNQGQNAQRGGGGGGGNNNNQPTGSQPSQRALQEARVAVVPDPRTNSIIVNASKESMAEIALTIGRLDASEMKKQHVYVHVLEHADPDNVAGILRTMFGDTSSASQTAASVLNQRTSTGISSAVSNAVNNGSNTSGRTP